MVLVLSTSHFIVNDELFRGFLLTAMGIITVFSTVVGIRHLLVVFIMENDLN